MAMFDTELVTISVVKLSIFGFNVVKRINVINSIRQFSNKLPSTDPRNEDLENFLELIEEMTNDQFDHKIMITVKINNDMDVIIKVTVSKDQESESSSPNKNIF